MNSYGEPQEKVSDTFFPQRRGGYHGSTFASPPYPPRAKRVRPTAFSLEMLVCFSIGMAHITPTPLAAAPQASMRYEVGLANGARQQVRRITAWEPAKQSVRLDDHQWAPSDPALRWIFDHQSDMATTPESWLETWTGDRLPGNVINYSDGRDDAPPQPPHLIVRSVTSTRPPRQVANALVGVRPDCVRRIVWHDQGRDYQPSTVWTRDGRRIDFRAFRWGGDSVTLLTRDGRQTIPFQELSELNFPQTSPWPELIEELAVLAPEGTGQLIQFETSQGVIITTSWQRQRVLLPPDRSKASYWMQGVQPAWSLDAIWLPGDQIPMRRFFQPHETPLSRIRPTTTKQRSPLAGPSRPWRRDRNVEGGWLESGPGVFGWGFGVHAANELHFQLPPFANALSGFVGLDALAGSGGCVQTRLLLKSATTKTLFETPVIVGSQQAYALGTLQLAPSPEPRTLVLQVDMAHAQRPPNADPLDIRDSTDWLDPVLYFNRNALQKRVSEQTTKRIFACRDWQWHVPPKSRLRFRNIWDELSRADSHFAVGVSVEGPEPLRLVRRMPRDKAGQQLVITVSCPLRTNPPIRMQVLANGTPLASFEVPVLDREHIELAPQTIALETIAAKTNSPQTAKTVKNESVEFEIRQYPSTLDAPVQWHAIEFR